MAGFGIMHNKVLSQNRLLSTVLSVIRMITRKANFGLPLFNLKGQLGAGSFGSVILARHPHSPRKDKLVAVKLFKLNLGQQWVESAMSELSILLAVRDNPNAKDFFVEVFWAFVSCERINIVMEPAPYGNLRILVESRPGGRMEIDEARFYMADLAHALSLLHEMQISHGDIKPDNIVVCDGGRIKLCDLGLAIRHAEERGNVTHRRRGTFVFAAPEKYFDNPYIADWYSIGCVYFYLVTGEIHFVVDLNEETTNDPVGYKKEKLISLYKKHNHLYELIRDLTNPNPLERMCLNGVGELKAVPFFESTCWGCVALRKCCGKCVSPALPWQDREIRTSAFQISSFRDFDQCQTDLNTVSQLLKIGIDSKEKLDLVPRIP